MSENLTLPPCKVSWQNETTLRFAIKGAVPGQVRAMCAQVNLEVTAIRRLRRRVAPEMLKQMHVSEGSGDPA